MSGQYETFSSSFDHFTALCAPLKKGTLIFYFYFTSHLQITNVKRCKKVPLIHGGKFRGLAGRQISEQLNGEK
jgi:hypothetical protein